MAGSMPAGGRLLVGCLLLLLLLREGEGVKAPSFMSKPEHKSSEHEQDALQTLRRQSKNADKLLSQSQTEAEKSRMQRDAIAQDLDERLVQDPTALTCKCSHSARWAIVKKAKQELLKEEGTADSVDVSNGCPCKSTLVGAVTKVLEQKLSLLEKQLGSRTSAELAMQRALVAMRLPKFLAGDLAKELDQKLAAKAKLNHVKTDDKTEAEGEEDEDAEGSRGDVPDINVVVNNNLDGEEIQQGNQGNMTFNHDFHPYFHAYKYPPSYIQGEQEHSSLGKRPYIRRNYNIVVNVNNFLEPGSRHPLCTSIPCSRIIQAQHHLHRQFLREDKQRGGELSKAISHHRKSESYDKKKLDDSKLQEPLRKHEKMEVLKSDSTIPTSSEQIRQAHVVSTSKTNAEKGSSEFEDARERLKQAAEVLEKVAEDKAARIRTNMKDVQNSVPEQHKDKIQFATKTTQLHQFTDRFHVILPKPLKTKKVSKLMNPRSLLGHRGTSEELSGDEASKDLSSYFDAVKRNRKEHAYHSSNLKGSTGSVTWQAHKDKGESDRSARKDLFSYFDRLGPHPKQHVNTWLDDSHVLPTINNRFHANSKRRVSKNYHYISLGAEGHNNAMKEINSYYKSLEARHVHGSSA